MCKSSYSKVICSAVKLVVQLMLHSPSKAGNCNIKWYLKALNNSVEYGIKKTQGTNEYLVEKNSLS